MVVRLKAALRGPPDSRGEVTLGQEQPCALR